MKISVNELCSMIDNGILKYNQSTQRKFVYASIPVQIDEGTTTKSGSLIHAIIEKNIQLPAIYFWHNTDTGDTNLHDGKQRCLSIYYFINPTNAISVSTIYKCKETKFEGLPAEAQEKLLNYTFDVVENTGNSEEEEKSFYAINSNALPLTQYECLSGMMYGTFLKEFETYVETMSQTYDAVKPILRGEQAYRFLMTIFDVPNNNSASELILNAKIRPIRNNMFIASDYAFDKLLIAFNELTKTIKGISETNALQVANYIVKKQFDLETLLILYREKMRLMNDISKWTLDLHKTFINRYIYDKIKLDGQRFFNKDIKDRLYSMSPRCSHIDEITGERCKENAYNKLEIDHIVAWSNGGQTILDNATLLCKHCNTSKQNK